MTLRLEMVRFTPEMARKALEKIGVQRKLRRTVVAAYAKDMAEGRWEADTSAICFNEDGELVNGQHRLSAVVLSGCTVTFVVMRNVSKEAILRMDSGVKRSNGDQLHILGIPNSVAVAALARCVMLYRVLPNVVWSGSTTAQVTNAMVIDYAAANADALSDAARSAYAFKRLRFDIKSQAALQFLVEEDSKRTDLWPEFISGLESGVGLEADDPRLALRNYYTRPDLQMWGNGQSHLLTVLKVWNRWVEEQPTMLLRTPRRSELPMPKVV